MEEKKFKAIQTIFWLMTSLKHYLLTIHYFILFLSLTNFISLFFSLSFTLSLIILKMKSILIIKRFLSVLLQLLCVYFKKKEGIESEKK